MRYWDGDSWVLIAPLVGQQMDLSYVSPTSVGTATVITSIPTSFNQGSAITISGTVKTTAGANVTGGTVQPQWLNGSTWTNLGSAVAVSNGAWTTTVTLNKTVAVRGVFGGSGINLTSTSASKTVTMKVLTTVTKTYAASWSAYYDGGGAQESYNAPNLYYGYYSSTRGNTKSLIGFPALGLPAGASVTKAEVYVYVDHMYDAAGGTVYFGTAASTSKPSTWPAYTARTSATFARDEGKYVTLPSAVHAGFANDTIRAVTLGPGPSNSLAYYGYARGVGQSAPPVLRITYTYYA